MGCILSPPCGCRSRVTVRIHYYSGVEPLASSTRVKAIELRSIGQPRAAVPTWALLLASGLLVALSACTSGTRPARIGTVAPDFSVQDAQNKITLSQYRGQVVVLNFWATWCPPCVEEMPSLVEMQRRMKAKGVTVLAVSVDVDEGAYKQFLKDHNVSLLTVRDPEHKSSELYGTFKYPETYVIDRGGVMRRKFIGAVDWTEPDVVELLGKL